MRLAFVLLAATMNGSSVADLRLAPIEPGGDERAAAVGLAGEHPPAFARYLLARGAIAAAAAPDGEDVAILSDVTGSRQLWLVPADGGQPLQLTHGRGITFFFFFPSKNALMYGADNEGNEQEAFYAISRDGLEERMVLPAIAGGFPGGYDTHGVRRHVPVRRA